MSLAAALVAGAVAVAGGGAGQPPGEAPPEPAVVWAVGDGADGSDLARGVARLIRQDEPDRLIYLGDVYNTGTPAEFRRNFGGVYGRRLARITEPTIGNHEWDNRRRGYFPYWRRVKGRRVPPWYRVSVGGWELFSLNTEADRGAGSPQLRWLERALEGAAGDCRLAFWHRPRFSAGTSYGDDPAQRALWRALVGRARLVLSGHEHNMQRLKARGGIVQVVSGAGGTNLYPLRADYPGLRFGRSNRRGALRIELRPGSARLEFRGVRGRRLDSTSLRCTPG